MTGRAYAEDQLRAAFIAGQCEWRRVPERQWQRVMSADLVSWLPLAIKLLLTATIVVGASIIAERAGALTGALVATLPVTVWPAYVFLSLDHDAGFMAQAVLSGLVMNAVTGVFLLIYSALAQRHGVFVSLVLAVGSWIVLALFARSMHWTLTSAVLLNLVAYPVCLWLGSTMRTAAMPQLGREWYDLPMRTIMVCALMATVLEISNWAGPTVTGILATYPISSTSLILILQPRLGGRASAAVSANSLWSLCGIGLGLAAMNLSIGPLGAPFALAAALAIPVAWNMTVWIVHRRHVLAAH